MSNATQAGLAFLLGKLHRLSARRADLNACGVPYVLSDDLADVIQQLRALHVPLRARAL